MDQACTIVDQSSILDLHHQQCHLSMAIPQVVYLPIDDLHKGGVTYSPIKVERFAQQESRRASGKDTTKSWRSYASRNLSRFTGVKDEIERRHAGEMIDTGSIRARCDEDSSSRHPSLVALSLLCLHLLIHAEQGFALWSLNTNADALFKHTNPRGSRQA